MLKLYSIRGEKTLTAYERQQTWRARQYAYNQNRLDNANSAVNAVFAARMTYSRQIGDLVVSQAVTRVQSGVNKLV